MSLDINIHLWLGDDKEVDPLEVFEQVLNCTAVPEHPDIDGNPPPRFRRLKVWDRAWSSTEFAFDKIVLTNDTSEVLRRLKAYGGSRFHYEVESAFDCSLYNASDRSLNATVHPLSLNYFGSEYEWQGYPFKRYGLIRIDFSNTKTFQVPQALIEQIKSVADRRGDATRWLQMPPRIGSNFEAVSGLTKRLISALNPVHLLVCTNLEVNPLTSHAIYHRDIQDYVRDLNKIARLHECGGVYFCDVTPDEPAFIPARKSPPNYGYMRDQYVTGTEEQFVEMLQPMVNEILHNPEAASLSNDEIKACLSSLDSAEIEELNDSYYLSALYAPFAYLGEPYFKLYQAAYDTAREIAN